MVKNFRFRLENENDYWVTENLVRESFWNVYKPGCSEHFVLHKMRANDGFIKELSILIEISDDDFKTTKMIGQVAFFKAIIKVDDDAENKLFAGKDLPILTFGPICIANEYKRKGYGKFLLDYALDKASNMNFGAVCMEGNIDFYSNCGFDIAQKRNIFYHGMNREDDCTFLLCKELKKSYLDGIKGTYYTPDVYFVDDKDVDEYDKNFPKKEKLKLPGQLFN